MHNQTLTALSDMLDHMDEPLSDSSLIVTWFLFDRIKEMGLRCVLSGDGADERYLLGIQRTKPPIGDHNSDCQPWDFESLSLHSYSASP